MTIENLTEENKESWRQVGAFIRQLREGIRVSRKQFEVKTGISQSLITALENGYSSCSLPNLTKIAEGLGVSVVVLAARFEGKNKELQEYLAGSYVLPVDFGEEDKQALAEWIDMRQAWREKKMKNSPDKDADELRAHNLQVVDNRKSDEDKLPAGQKADKPTGKETKNGKIKTK